MLESKIEAKVVKHCRDCGILTYKFSSPAHCGVPDRFFAKAGLIMFLELKSPGNEPTALQQHELDRLSRQGIYATWADSYEKAVQLIDDFFAQGII